MSKGAYVTRDQPARRTPRPDTTADMDSSRPPLSFQQGASSVDAAVQNITLGTVAIFVAVAGLAVAYLQLRRMRGWSEDTARDPASERDQAQSQDLEELASGR